MTAWFYRHMLYVYTVDTSLSELQAHKWGSQVLNREVKYLNMSLKLGVQHTFLEVYCKSGSIQTDTRNGAH